MITKEQMLPMLVESCPSFADKWHEHQQEYSDEENYLPYIALGEFARHLISLDRQNQTAEFGNVFETVERLHLEGEQYVREAVTIGLLEALQNNLKDDAEKFVKYLKPKSLKWWNELNKFWNSEIKFVWQTINEQS
jgi:hypothetical protein